MAEENKRVPATSLSSYIRGVKVSEFPVPRVRLVDPDSAAERQLGAELYKLNVRRITDPEHFPFELQKLFRLASAFHYRRQFRLRCELIEEFVEGLWVIDNIHVRVWLGQLRQSIRWRKREFERLEAMREMSAAELNGRPRPTLKEMQSL